MRFGIFLMNATLGMISFASVLESNVMETSSGSSSHGQSMIANMDGVSFYSQASQDKFIYTLLYDLMGKQDKGCYLEIGAGEPININNSYFFEKNLQWDGVSIEIAADIDQRWHAIRTNPLLIEDATKSDYTKILQNFPFEIDYLSLDIDGYYDTILERIPFNEHIFKIITIEHDFYRYGDLYRSRERQILNALGYHMLCSDVLNEGNSFEDWWIHPSAFSSDVFSALTSLDLQEKEHTEIMQAIQTITRDNPQD